MLSEKEAKLVWQKVFKRKIERVIDHLYSLRKKEERILFLKVCFRADPSVQEMLLSEIGTECEKKIHKFADSIWDLVTDHALKMKLDRMASWYVRIGLHKEIWRNV